MAASARISAKDIIALQFVLLSVTAALLAGVIGYRDLEFETEKDFASRRAYIDDLASSFRADLLAGQFDGFLAELQRATGFIGASSLIVTDSNSGREMNVRSPYWNMTGKSNGSEKCGTYPGAMHVSLFKRCLRYQTAVYFDTHKSVPALTISWTSDGNPFISWLRRFLDFVLLFSAMACFLYAVVRYIAYKYLVAPLDHLSTAIQSVPGRMKEGRLGELDVDEMKMASEVSVLARQMQAQLREIDRLQVEVNQAIVVQAVGKMASQVAHDIRSPLSALNMILTSDRGFPEDKRMIVRNSINRINDIANALLRKGREPESAGAKGGERGDGQTKAVMLVSLIDAIISEKRIEYRNRMEIDINADLNGGYGLFARIDAAELARAVSNLINNAVEAIDGPGSVTVKVSSQTDDLVSISVSDSGRGVPSWIISRLGEPGFTYGKNDRQGGGNGLGLAHAKGLAESVGGSLAIRSQERIGTSVIMNLPKADPPVWFVDCLKVRRNTTFVSVDDDQTIHQIWEGRLKSSLPQDSEIRHLKFSSYEAFESWLVDQSDKSNIAILMDFEFIGASNNGLDIILRHGLNESAILVTSRFDEPHVITRAISNNVRMIPKSLAAFLPIAESREPWADAVLLDDDELVHMTWKMTAESENKHVMHFKDADDSFYSELRKLDRRVPVFIDVSLAQGVRGDAVAERVAKLGFKRIRLATGYQADQLSRPSYVERIVGKDPDFR